MASVAGVAAAPTSQSRRDVRMTTHRVHGRRAVCSSARSCAVQESSSRLCASSRAAPRPPPRTPVRRACTANNAELTITSNRLSVRQGEHDHVHGHRLEPRRERVRRDRGRRHPASGTHRGPHHVRIARGRRHAAGRDRAGCRRSGSSVRGRRRRGREQRRRPGRRGRGGARRAVDHAATQNKTIGTVSTQPALSLTVAPTPASGIVPLNVTYDYVLSNTSTTDVPIANPTINGGGVCADRTRRQR